MRTLDKVKTYKYYCDSGHGWLAVKRDELEELNLVYKISSYSYQKNTMVYLEEDCDMQIFLRAVGAKYTSYNIKEVYHNGSSKIRSYQGYTQDKLQQIANW